VPSSLVEKFFYMSGLSWISIVRHNLCTHLFRKVYDTL
jgi:hypothetical protein